MVEFALVSMVMLVVVLGLIDFGYLFYARVGVYEQTRIAVRYAAINPSAWKNTQPPPGNSIEGQLRLNGVQLPNDNAHITISYLVPGVGAATVCGTYDASTDTFSPAAAKATCVVSGHVVRIQASYLYNFLTPFLKSTFGSITIHTDASALIE